MEQKSIEKIKESMRNLEKVLGHLLGVSDLEMDIEVEETKGGDKDVYIVSNPISFGGIFRFMIEEVRITSFGRVWENEKKEIIFNPHFSYKHPDGGSNGHDLYLGNKRITMVLKEIPSFSESFSPIIKLEWTIQ